MSRFEKEILPFIEEEIMRKLRTYNVYSTKEGVPYIFHHSLLNEINYEERGYPESVSERVKHTIADDITEALNDKLKGLKDEALNYALSEFDKRKHGLEATVKNMETFRINLYHYDYYSNN